MNQSLRALLAAAAISALPMAAAMAQGKEAYDANCKKCHGATGTPAAAMAKRYTKLEAFDAAFFAKRTDDSLMAVLMNGTGKDMKSYKDRLTKDEMIAVSAYIKTFAKP